MSLDIRCLNVDDLLGTPDETSATGGGLQSPLPQEQRVQVVRFHERKA